MSVFTLNNNEFYDNNFTLLVIHTALSDYKLAYLLNLHLQIKFRRANSDFTNKSNKVSFSVYEYKNIDLDYNWHLISNKYKSTNKIISNGLFADSDYVINLSLKEKKVDFFLKIEGDFGYEYIVKTIEKINKIPQIITSYKINIESLKSKEFLIF